MVDTLLSLGVTDDDGQIRSVPVFLPAATTQANIATYAAAYAALLDAVVDGQITRMEYTIALAVPGGLKASPAANCEVQKGANFSFLNASRYKYGLFIPSWIPGFFTGNEVDLESAGVAEFVDAYVTGIGGVAPTNGYSDDLLSLSKSKKTFRK